MLKSLSKIVMLVSLALASGAFASDLTVNNLVNSPSNAMHNWYWGNQVPAWQTGKFAWEEIDMRCRSSGVTSEICDIEIFAEVTSNHPVNVATVHLNLITQVVDSVTPRDHANYHVCVDPTDADNLFLVRAGSHEAMMHC